MFRAVDGDKAYDSDRLDQALMQNYGTEMIAPNRAKRTPTQDGRPLRRYIRAGKLSGSSLALQLPPVGGALRVPRRKLQGFVHLAAAIILLSIYEMALLSSRQGIGGRFSLGRVGRTCRSFLF